MCEKNTVASITFKPIPVPVCHAIIVYDEIPDNTRGDIIKLYFENEKRSGGGEVVLCDFNEDENYCVLEFKQPEGIVS